MNWKKQQIQIDLTKENVDYITFRAKEIIENGQSYGRTYDTILNQVKRGYISELAVSKLYGLEFNSLKEFNPSDPNSFAYDLINEEGKTFEIKTLGDYDSAWLNINQHKFKHPNLKYGSFPDVSTALKYQNYIDYIVFCKQNENIVNVQYLFKMNDFARNLKVSRYNASINSTHYLNPNSINLLK